MAFTLYNFHSRESRVIWIAIGLKASKEHMSGAYHAGINGADAMDEDGALPSSMPSQAPDLNFDADITPEEMQMMASMGIPFGFDTTQVIYRQPLVVS